MFIGIISNASRNVGIFTPEPVNFSRLHVPVSSCLTSASVMFLILPVPLVTRLTLESWVKMQCLSLVIFTSNSIW